MSKPRWFIMAAMAALLPCVGDPARPEQGASAAGQRRRSASRPAPAFMQQVRSFEETQYVAKAVLKNGATVLVNEIRNDPVVAILIRVEAGNGNDPKQMTGASRVLEQMFYRSASSRGSGAIAKDIRAMGGILASAVDQDHTSYRVTVPSVQWKKALEIQLEALTGPRYSEHDLRSAVNSILGEAARLSDSPGNHLLRKQRERILGWRSVVGTEGEGSLRDLDLEKLLLYRTRTYAPERVRLVVSGDVNTSDVLNDVARHYGRFRGSAEKPEATAKRPEMAGLEYQQIRGQIPFPVVSLGFPAAAVGSEDYPSLEVLVSMLARGEGSILTRQLRERDKIVIRQGARLDAYRDAGILTFQLEVDARSIDRAEIGLFTEFEVLKRREPDAEEMARALATLEREYWARRQAVEGRAESLAHFDSLGGWKRLEEYLPRLRKVSPADVSRVARKFLRPEYCSLLEYLPAAMEERPLSAEIVRKTLEDLMDTAVEQELEARERVTRIQLEPGESSGAFKFSEVRHPMRKSSIFRGPDLYIREDHTTPIVHVGILFPGGVLQESAENSGITALMLRWMLRGSREVGPERMYRQLELYGARVRPVVEDDCFGILVTALSRNTEKSLDLLFEMIKSPKLDPGELDRLKVLQASEAARRHSGPAYSQGLVRRLLFGDFPYALDRQGEQPTVSRLTPEEVTAWYKETVTNRKPLVVIIGDTEGTSLARYFVRSFSGSRFEETRIPEGFAKPLEKRSVLEEEMERTGSIVALGFQAPPEGDEDAYPISVLEHHLSGPGGLLTDELRDRLGLAHSVSVCYSPLLRGGSLTALLTADAGSEAKALEALEGVIRRTLDAPIPYRDFRTAVSAAAGEFRIRLQSPVFQILRLVRFVLNGKGVEELEEYPGRLEAVSEEDLHEAAHRILNLEKAAVVRLRGRPLPPPGAAAQN